jgi:hypothetical protein
MTTERAGHPMADRAHEADRAKAAVATIEAKRACEAKAVADEKRGAHAADRSKYRAPTVGARNDRFMYPLR